MNHIRKALAGALVCACIAGPAAADMLRFGAMPVGSGWYVGAAAIQNAIEPVLEGHTIEVIPRGGGVANPMVVEQGGAEIALSNVQTAVMAMTGDEELYGDQKAENIRALLGGLNRAFVGVLVRRDFIERTGLETLADLLESDEAIRIVMKPPGSNIPPAADVMFAAHGTSRDQIRANGGEIIQVDTAQIPAVLRDGRADVMIDVILRGHPMITEVTLTTDVVFLDLSDEAITALSEIGIRPDTMPVWFEGQPDEVKSGDFGTLLIAHADLPEDVAYAVTKAVIENIDKIVADYPAFADFVPEEAWMEENVGIPLHPGAERYFRERGWM